MTLVINTGRSLERGIRKAENIVGYVGRAMLFILMFLGASDVILRFAFNSPIFGATEFMRILMGGIVFLGWAYTLQQRGHIAVDIVFDRYPRRAQAIIEFVMLFVTLVIFILICWQSLVLALSDIKEGLLFTIIPIPMGPFELMVPFGAFFLCLECIIQLFLFIPRMRSKEG